MKKLALALMILTPNLAQAEGYVLSTGRATCPQVVEIAENGSPMQRGQLAGWILGYWSAVTFSKPTEFIDIVENAGGERIYGLTIQACKDSDPEVMLYQVTQNLIKNTG